MIRHASFDARPDVTPPTLLRQVANLMRQRLRERRRGRTAQARMRVELETYSDRGLADIGLCRGDIEDVVHHRYAC